MTRKKKVILIPAVVIVLALFAILSLTSNGGTTTKVSAAEVKCQDLVEEVSASGRIQPKTKVDITSEINGEIIALPVREGQQVAVGDLLVVLDTVQIAADVTQARYALDEMRARLAGAKTTMEQNQEEFERQERLYQGKLTSETAYKNARYAHLNSKSTYEATQAQTGRLRAAFEKQLDYLDKATIVAPMAGSITFLDVEVGEIAAAQTPFTQGKTLMTISNLDLFEVEVEVDETEINKVELGQAAKIEVDAIPDTTFEGEVIEIGNTAVMVGLGTQDQSTNFKVKVMFSDVDLKLRPGMSATVDITSADRKDVLAIPFSSVVVRTYDLDSLESAREAEDSGGTAAVTEVQAAENEDEEASESDENDKEKKEHKGVFVIRNGVARFATVETGIAGQKNVEVVLGLSEKDSVVTGPYRVLRTIKDGDAVEVTKESGKEEQ